MSPFWRRSSVTQNFSTHVHLKNLYYFWQQILLVEFVHLMSGHPECNDVGNLERYLLKFWRVTFLRVFIILSFFFRLSSSGENAGVHLLAPEILRNRMYSRDTLILALTRFRSRCPASHLSVRLENWRVRHSCIGMDETFFSCLTKVKLTVWLVFSIPCALAVRTIWDL